MTCKPVVLFVCVQNAGRSQMAEALFTRTAAGRAEARSAGSRPAAGIHPVVREALAEIGLDPGDASPKGLGPEVTSGVDVVVTMGCGDQCPVIPGARVVDWDLEDPSGQPIEMVRTIRDDIERRTAALVRELTGA
jgi:protein-tyrosine-phosphatase